MNAKWFLFSGLIILAIGIVLRGTLDGASWPVVLILLGIGLKLVFIFRKMKEKQYRAGVEMFFLIIGLALFFSGVYISLNSISFPVDPLVLKITGITLKLIFIILFIRKTK